MSESFSVAIVAGESFKHALVVSGIQRICSCGGSGGHWLQSWSNNCVAWSIVGE